MIFFESSYFPIAEYITLCASAISIPPKIYSHWIDVMNALQLKIEEENQSINTRTEYENFVFTQHFPIVDEYYSFHYDVKNIISKQSVIKRSKQLVSAILKNAVYDITATDHATSHTVTLSEHYSFTDTLKSYVVIDGNHALNTAINKNTKWIDTFFIVPQKDDFVFQIDYAFYKLIMLMANSNRIEAMLSFPDQLMYYLDHLLLP